MKLLKFTFVFTLISFVCSQNISFAQGNKIADEIVKFSKTGLEINGEPVSSMCAEFHYWRTDPKHWDDILGRLIKGSGLKMVASYIPWSIHEPKKGVFDFTGVTNPGANLEGFLKLVKKHNLYFFARSGPLCYGEIDGGGPTDYANIAGKRTEEFLDLTEEWVEQISKVWKEYSIHNGGPVVFVQMDNEVMSHDLYFSRFLKEKYGSVKSINKRWETNFNDFESIVKNKDASEGKHSWLNYMDVMEYQTRYFPRWYVSSLRKMYEEYGTDVPLMTNNTFFILQDWYELQKEVEFIGLDYYGYYLLPGDAYYWDYLTLSLNNNINNFPFSPEFQCGSSMTLFGPTPSQHQKLVTFFALASGMRGVNYYMFVERERWEGYCPVTETGKIRPEWYAHKHFFKVLKDINWVDLQRQCSVGLLWSQEQYWRYIYEGGRKYNIQFDDYTEVASRTYECAQQPMWAFVKTLINTDTNFDMVDIRTDLSKYPVLIYAGTNLLDAAFQKKLVGYVKGGGRLILLSQPPDKEYDETSCSELVKGLGLERGEAVQKETTVLIADKRIETYLFTTFKSALPEEIIVKTEDGEACAVRKRVGKGEVIQFGFSALENEIFNDVVRLTDLPLHVQGDNSWVQTSLFRSDDAAVVIAINRNTEEETVKIRIFPDLTLPEDVWIEEEFTHNKLKMEDGQTYEITIPANDVAVIHIRKHEKIISEPDPDEQMRKLFKGVGFSQKSKEE